MPSHQPPAVRAANRAFHDKEESKKGKKVRAKPKEAVSENQEAPKVVRRGRRANKDGSSNNVAIAILASILIGGALIQLMFLFTGRD